ncbi:sacsin N-terminal ATP-binding-like domain-containing protein [Planctomycetota bacterium]
MSAPEVNRDITSKTAISPPSYFHEVQKKAHDRWNQLEADPELAGPWYQLFKQVQSPRHVLSELLQNADDAEATWASVSIEDGEFIFEHDGMDFTLDHFASLCKFGYSNKRNLHTIGFRGIGFKSTFSLGDEVILLSPTLSVSFNKERFTEPTWTSSNTEHCTTQIRVSIKDQYRLREIIKNLEEWASSPLSLLFFRNIHSITINGETIERIVLGSGPVEDSQWISLSSEQDKPLLLIKSPKAAFPPDSLEEIRQERMGADDLDMPPCEVSLVVGGGQANKLFVVLPTGIETALPFACNAPFIQDPARVKIKDPETSPTNRWLLSRAGELAAKVMLSWLGKTGLSIKERCQAYSLFPSADTNENSLEGICSTVVDEAIKSVIEDRSFVLTDKGDLVKKEESIAVPRVLYEIWDTDGISGYFDKQQRAVFCRFVTEPQRSNLIKRDYVTCIPKERILEVLECRRLPKPNTWYQLLLLWDFVGAAEAQRHYFHRNYKNKNILPVQGKDTLYKATEVVRLSEKKLLKSQDDWEFLSPYLLVLNQNWLRYLSEQKRIGDQENNESLLSQVENADDLLKKIDFEQASDVSQVIERVATAFFEKNEIYIENCKRLTHIAATLRASVSDHFKYVTQSNKLVSAHNTILVDINHDLDLYFEKQWYDQHTLHELYGQSFQSCSEQDWAEWVSSEKSRLFAFAPLKPRRQAFRGRDRIKKLIVERGVKGLYEFPYVTESFVLHDYDFDSEHWEHWKALANEDEVLWGKLVDCLFSLPSRHWSKAFKAKICQVATTGTEKSIANEALLPAWIMKFKSLACIQDTYGCYREPIELLRRTSDTEALLDTEPFVRSEYDTERLRPLLVLFGVRDTPTGPDKLLDRIRALSKASNPPIYEVEKWYSRLDHLTLRCTADEIQKIREAFSSEKLILAHDQGWFTSTDVYLASNEIDFPEAATIHPSIQSLSLWQRIGVPSHPTVESAMSWLKSLNSQSKLSSDQLRRVRALLPRYSVQIWNECECWLNLEAEWISTKQLEYQLSMQSLVSWKHLFPSIKSKTADLQYLSTDLCNQPPFSTLKSLASSIKEQIQDGSVNSIEPERKAWLNALGQGLARIVLDDKVPIEEIRHNAIRLSNTIWQYSNNIETTPYIANEPVGLPRKVDVVWKDEVLYVSSQNVVSLYQPIANELARSFGHQDISDAIKACVDRSANFINEYLKGNFTLLTKQEINVDLHNKVPEAEYTTEEDRESEVYTTAPGDPTTFSHDNTVTGPLVSNNTSIEIESSDGINVDEDEILKPIALKPVTKHDKPRFIEIYAQQHGYKQDPNIDRFYHRDGSWLQKDVGGIFTWTKYTADGQQTQSYWLREHCLKKHPLKIDAEIWKLIQNQPGSHSLILADVAGNPVEMSGSQLKLMLETNRIRLFPAEYRIQLSDNGEAVE